MKTSKELREERASLIQELKDVKHQAEKEDRELTQEESDKFDRINDDVTALQRKIQQAEAMERLEAEESHEPESREEEVKLEYKDVFRKMLLSPGGVADLTSEERSVMLGKVTSDIPKEMRAQSTTTTAGGYTIPEGFISEIEKTLLYFAPVMDIATMLNTSTGNDLPFPTNDDTSNKGAILNENTVVAEQDLTFGQTTFKAYKIYSKLIRVSLELMQDNAVNLESFLAEQLGERIGRYLTEIFTTGTGSSQPQGYVSGAGNSSISSFAASAITRDNIVDLIHSVDRAYRMSPNFRISMHDSTLAYLRKLAFGTADDRPLYQEGNATAGEPDRIEGVPVFINNEMAEIGASNKSLVVGDFSKLVIRQALPSQLFIFNERYMDYLQKGFMTFGRWDSKVINSSAFKYAQHAAT